MDIANQTVTYFADGKIMLQTPCVTGNEKQGTSTPVGEFSVINKTTDTYLIGPTWKVWAERWMGFTKDGCEFHDASWRTRFGGEIYKTNGSHGCVNLPHEAALELYDLVPVGTIVVVK